MSGRGRRAAVLAVFPPAVFSTVVFLTLVFLTVVLATAVLARADAPTPVVLRAETGFDIARGDYGQARTSDTVSVPFGVSLERGGWLAVVSSSWLRVTGPGDPRFSLIPQSASASGIDDVRLGLSYLWIPPPARADWPFVGGGLELKVPVASREQRLGTGEVDLSVRLDGLHLVGTRLALQASTGWTYYGDGGGFVLEDGFFASAGADWLGWDVLSLGASLGWQQNPVGGAVDVVDLAPSASWALGPWSVSPYLSIGLTESAPDWGGGLQLSVELLRLERSRPAGGRARLGSSDPGH